MAGHSDHTGDNSKLVPLCNATSNVKISVLYKYAISAISSVTSAKYETMYHEKDYSYFNINSMGIPNEVISTPTLTDHSHSNHDRSLLPSLSCGNNLHVLTELDEKFLVV